MISIHSPHAGRDVYFWFFAAVLLYFNPLSPCGERHTIIQEPDNWREISIHSPHAGRDE